MQTMMKLAGVSGKYLNECSLQEFIRQSDNYQDLDRDGLNQVYKFFLYNGGLGTMLSHPFPVERLRYLRDWANSEEYRQIRAGNYKQAVAEGSVEVESDSSSKVAEVEALRRQIEELQEQINRRKSE
jgi:hypothetical protein